MEHHQLCKQHHRAPFLPPIWYKNRLFSPDFCHLAPFWPESLLKAKPFTLSPCGSISLWHKKLQPSFIVCHFRNSNRHSRSRPCACPKVNKCRALQGSCIFWSKTMWRQNSVPPPYHCLLLHLFLDIEGHPMVAYLQMGIQ